jgi:NADH-quinone oxidoreductase subunit L
MPWTSASFFIGGLALCGFPGLAGFFSKDEILVLAHERNTALYWLGTLTAGMTAFYIARAWFVAFTGKTRGRPHESPPVMTGPLVLLAALSVVGGYLGIPRFLGEHEGIFHWVVAAGSTAVVAAGLLLAWLIYGKRALAAQQLVQALALPYSFLQRRYYIDEIYNWYVAVIQQKLIAGLCAWVERHVIIGLMVNGTAWLTQAMGRVIRLFQTGRIQTYVLAFLLGIVWLLAIPLGR